MESNLKIKRQKYRQFAVRLPQSIRRGFFFGLGVSCIFLSDLHKAGAWEVAIRGGPNSELWVKSTNVYNPRGTNGLVSIMSISGDYSIAAPYGSGTAHYEGAVYGSDSAIDRQWNPMIEDLAIEPMADAQAEAKASGAVRTEAYVTAEIEVYHRVLARAFPAELEERLKLLSEVPSTLLVRISVSADGSQDLWGSSASASCSIEPASSTQFGTSLGVSSRNGPAAQETNIVLKPKLKRYWTNDVYTTYTIFVSAHVTVNGSHGAPGSGQAVIDPLLQVDPDWEYAPYFYVVQESTRHPGQWIELTREWTNTLVRPALTMARSNSALTLSWPATAGIFDVQFATNLAGPIMWNTATNPPVLGANSLWEIVVTETTAPQHFYRLISR